jgi:hypothetical protein
VKSRIPACKEQRFIRELDNDILLLAGFLVLKTLDAVDESPRLWNGPAMNRLRRLCVQ